MEQILNNEDCCGCGACQLICPSNSIHMMVDDKGFKYPQINSKTCLNCTLCEKVCPVLNQEKFKNEHNVAYGAYNKDLSVRRESTSGGVFSAVANAFINDSGIVYGAISENNRICHIRTEDLTGIKRMRGSKYVQSELEDVFFQVERDLREGKKVLFTGTPCQCASLKSFLLLKKISTSTLFTMDFVCHGVCSSKVFEDYIAYYNTHKKARIVEHRFRDKTRGWSKHTEVNILENGKVDYDSYESQLFKSIFHSHYAIRESCFHCRFTTEERVSDITLADFWGVQKSHPKQYDEKGVSFLLVNSKKGKEFLYEIQDMITLFEANISDVDQPQLHYPCRYPQDMQKFWKAYAKGFDYAMIKFFHAGKIRRFASDTLRRICGRRKQ